MKIHQETVEKIGFEKSQISPKLSWFSGLPGYLEPKEGDFRTPRDVRIQQI